MPIIRVTRKQIEAANKAREAALKNDEAAYGGDLIVIKVEKTTHISEFLWFLNYGCAREMAIPTSLR